MRENLRLMKACQAVTLAKMHRMVQGMFGIKPVGCHLSCIEVMLVVSATSHGSVRMPADNENSAITHWE